MPGMQRHRAGVRALLWLSLVAWLPAAEPGLALSLRAVPLDAGGRLILQADRPFAYRVQAAGREVEIDCDRPVTRFVVERTAAGASFFRGARLAGPAAPGRVRVEAGGPVTLRGTSELVRPFRLVVDLDLAAAPPPSTQTVSDDTLAELSALLAAVRFQPSGRPEAVEQLLNSASDLEAESAANRLEMAGRVATLGDQLGLNLAAGYVRNSRLGIPDLEDGPYRWRLHAGVSWDFLAEGLLKRRNERRLLRQNLLAESLSSWARHREENYYFLHDRVIHLFLPDRIRLLEIKRRYLRERRDLQRRLVWGGTGPLEDLIEVERDLAATENQLANSVTYRQQMETHARLEGELRAADLAVVDIDMDRLTAVLSRPPALEARLALNELQATQRNRFWDDVHLRAWLHYNLYQRDPNRTDFFSFGLSLNLPFPFQLAARREDARRQRELADLRYDRDRQADILEAMNAYDEYRTKLDDLIRFLAKRAVLQQRSVRLAWPRRQAGEEAREQAFDLLRGQIDVELEILDIRMQLLLRMLKVFRHSERPEIAPYLKPLDWPALAHPERALYRGDRALYVWSPAFAASDNEFLVLFMRSRAIRTVLLSPGRGADPAKAADFLRLAHENGIEVHALGSAVEWLRPEAAGAVQTFVAAARAAGYDGVHIDIEPYNQPDWKKRRNEYLQQHVDLLARVRAALPDAFPLSASLPLFYPPERLQEIYALCDRVYMMAYHSADPAVIMANLAPALACGRDKTTVTLRLPDFAGEPDLEQAIDRLLALGAPPAIALHHLGLFTQEEGTHEAEN